MNKKPTPPPARKKQAPASARPAKQITETKSPFNIKIILMILVLAISFVIYLKNLYGFQEFTNIYIKRQASWIVNIQPIIAFLVYAAFGYVAVLFLNSKDPGKKLYIAMGVALILIVSLHWLAFNASFEDVDDNASYMIAAKSLVQYHAPYYLYRPDMMVDTEGALGLPIMLIPAYWIWGMDYKPMEILIFLTMLGSVAMCYLLFKQLTDKLFAFLLAVVFATHPYVVAFSSIIMTEIPYLFWSMLAIYLVMKYQSREKFSIWLLIGATIAVFMTYLTRAVGIGLVVGTVVYTFSRSNMWPYLQKKSFGFFRDTKFLRFIFISLALFACVLIYQLWAKSLGGASQAEALAKLNIAKLFHDNFDAAWKVFAQNIYTGSLIRWEVKEIEPVGFLWLIVTLITMFGWIISLLKRELVAISSIFVIIVLFMGNTAIQPIVVSRYLIIFTPFLIYFLYKGVQWPVSKLIKAANWDKLAGTLVLATIMASSFTGNAYTIQKSHTGELYNPGYAAFIECAKWAKDNLPKDAIVASRKERIFYIFSDLKGYKHARSNELKDVKTEADFAAYKKKKLEEFAKNNTKYVIIDTFNSSTMNFIAPIIQENPDKFKLIKTIGDPQKGPCYVFEVIKWWK
jgi:4-amino-4-deoxy-L-arabinose transferase-like glycosyltransferase